MANIKENKKFHFTYKTTNLINGRYYLGMHSTNRLDDMYLGSGKRLYYEVDKYGRKNFKLEILEQFNLREELVQAEIKLITEEDIKNPNCLNLKPGGTGGYRDSYHKELRTVARKEGHRKYFDELKTSPDLYKKHSQNISLKMQEHFKTSEGSFKGKKHTPETIELMKKAKQETGKGSTNSQYGTCWITNELESRKVDKGNLIPEGWRLGRKLNRNVAHSVEHSPDTRKVVGS